MSLVLKLLINKLNDLILHMVIYMTQCYSLNSSPPLLHPPPVHKSVLYVCLSIAVLQIGSLVPASGNSLGTQIWYSSLNLERWDGVGGRRRFRREGTCAYLWLIHVGVWQSPTQQL